MFWNVIKSMTKIKKIIPFYHTNPKDPKDIFLYCNIDKANKKIVYFLNSKAAQYKWVKTISIDGFERLPAGFTKDGGGLSKGTGYLIIKGLFDKFGEFNLFVSKNKKTLLNKNRKKVSITFNYVDLRLILNLLRDIKSQNFVGLRSTANDFLAKHFKRYFKISSATGFTYKQNELRNLLNKNEVFKNLSNDDAQKLIDFYPEFLRHYAKKFANKKTLLGIQKNKKATEIIYLDKAIKDFERRINAKTQNEQDWQEFLRKYILVFYTNYTAIIEKKNISLAGKYPDFLPINVYGYLDIYEIKKPNTTLLSLDRSRDNYFWSTELSKALAQVENYLFYANRNSLELKDEIKRKEGIDIKVVRPRGFIIAGSRSQFKNGVMEDGFRLLNGSLKNIEIILYDDLLNNLKALLERLRGTKRKKRIKKKRH